MDSARQVIKRILNPRFLSYMAASYGVVSARQVIKRILNPRFFNYMASCDMASTIH